MTVPEKLSLLRDMMKERGIAAYIIESDDFHCSEYVGDHFKARAYMSGFTGSAGTLAVLPDWAGLWTDGRYFIQAAQQLEGSGIELMKMREPGVKDLPEYLADALPEGAVVGFDGRMVSSSSAEGYDKKLGKKHVTYHCDEDLVGEIWKDRPPLSAKPVWELDAKYAGLTREEKLKLVREKLDAEKADTLVLAALDEIAWLLNLRGDDVECSPVFLSFMLVDKEKAVLCAQESAISDDIRAKLAAAGVELAPYGSIYERVAALPDGSSVWMDAKSANYRLVKSVPEKAKLVKKESPVVLMKAVKTKAEYDNIRIAHVKDGVAVTRFMYWLKHTIGKEPITELSAAAKILEFRQEQEGFIGPSFGSILAYGPHAALPHYSPSEASNSTLEPRSFCLADTGGHYIEGSTDITRTFAVGTLTDEEKRSFTLVLRGHLALAAAIFHEGCCGANLDILARQPLWDNGLDYNHGTGHGVGYLLNVHEGPHRVHWKIPGTAHAELREGMIVSNEPGLYFEGKYGVRHENLVLVRKGEKNEYGQFMYLENMTMVPFDLDAVDLSLMTETDIARLNAYHKDVYEKLSPHFSGDELEWLKKATAPVEKSNG